MKRILAFLFAAILLCSCGDSVQYSETSSQNLTDKIFAVSSSHYVLDTLTPADTIFIERDKTVRLRAAAYLNGELLDSNRLADFYFFRYWSYGNNNYTTDHITILADSSKKNVCLVALDFIGDSSTTCVPILIDEPFAIEAIKPSNETYDIDLGSNVKFKAKATGIDKWENATCNLYVTNNLKSLWSEQSIKKSNFDCNQEQSIKLDNKNGDIFYWAIKATLANKKDSSEFATETMRFLTVPKIPAVLLPIVYDNARSKKKDGSVTLLLEDSTIEEFQIYGDTILNIEGLKSNQTYKAVIEEHCYTDYAKDSIEFAVIPNAYTLLDTVKLQDVVPPEAIPLQPSFALDDSIRFFVAEQGSGVNALKTAITISSMSDSLSYRYNGSRIAFAMNCASYCYAYVHLEDNSQNRAVKKAWKVSFEHDSIRVTGPYVN